MKISTLNACLFACALAILPSFAEAETPAKNYFGQMTAPSTGPSQSIGQYAAGCLQGAAELPETGPRWQAMRLSRNRNFGHPNLLAFVDRLSSAAAQNGWAGLYVGDMSQPRGGPMLTGHSSHQVGLDADIWMLPATRLNLTAAEREDISSISVVTDDFSQTNANFTQAHYNILKAAAQDPAVARIFVTPAVKVKMCDVTQTDRSWLQKIRPWWGHNYHFHVRLKCPAGSADCQNQDPITVGDGCDEARVFLNDLLHPKPVDPNAPKPAEKRPLTLANLPQKCTHLVQ